MRKLGSLNTVWCYIENDNVEEYLSAYPQLENYWDELVLLRTTKELFLPRLFLNNYPSKLLIEFHGKTEPIINNINFKFVGKLRPEQKKAADKIISIYNNNGYVNGILKLPTGIGKTVLAIYLASQLKLKTCIILNKETLLKQWVSEIIKFAGCTEDDIGLIRQKMFVSENKLFTIAMSGTLTSRIKKDLKQTFKDINDCGFGLVIYDEVHTTSSTENYSKCSLLFRSKNILGLSATPFHTDSSKILMNNTIGDIIFESKNYDMIPKYNLIHYNSGLNKYIHIINKFDDYIKKKAFYNKIILESEKYKEIIINLIRDSVKDKRKTIVICLTKNQIHMISELLDNLDIKHRKYYGDEREIDKVNDDLILATYSFAGTGFDFKKLDNLILATPLSGKKSLIQVIGRTLRKDDDKKQPVVYDLIDNCFPVLTIPEYRRKLNIIKTEFPTCDITESNY